jgi:hypothetical protein
VVSRACTCCITCASTVTIGLSLVGTSRLVCGPSTCSGPGRARVAVAVGLGLGSRSGAVAVAASAPEGVGAGSGVDGSGLEEGVKAIAALGRELVGTTSADARVLTLRLSGRAAAAVACSGIGSTSVGGDAEGPAEPEAAVGEVVEADCGTVVMARAEVLIGCVRLSGEIDTTPAPEAVGCTVTS